MSSYVAKKAARKQAEGLLSPLLETEALSSNDSDDSDDDDDSDASSTATEIAPQTPSQKLKSFAVVGGLAGGAAMCAAAMVLSPAVVTLVMGGICIANVPYAVFKEKKIGQLPGLRAMNHRMAEDAARLEEEVDALAAEIDALGPEADRAAELEGQLRSIAEAQEVNVNKLVDLVKENEEILSRMRDNLRRRILQDIISIVVKSDRDNDETIDRREAVTLALRIRVSLQEYGVSFDSDKFLQVIGRGTTVPAVIGLVQKLLPMENRRKDAAEEDDDAADDDDESVLEEGCLYDMFHMCDEPGEGGARGGVSLVCENKQRRKGGDTQQRRASHAPAGVQRGVAEARKRMAEECDGSSSGEDY